MCIDFSYVFTICERNDLYTNLSFLPRDAIHPQYYRGLCLSVCVCLSVCLSVTSRSSTKTAKQRITQITPHDTPGIIVF